MNKRTNKTRDMHIFLKPDTFELLRIFAEDKGLSRSSAIEMLIRERMGKARFFLPIPHSERPVEEGE